MRSATVAVACALLVACGLAHGYWTDRWVKPADLAGAGDRLRAVPKTLGEWEGEDLDAKATQPGLAGTLQRRYKNRRTGDEVVIALVCGRPGPVSIHTPEACYGASGFAMESPATVKIDGVPGEFFTAEPTRRTATNTERLRLYWAWHAGAGWVAAHDLRFRPSGTPVLYKLYVLREAGGAAGKDGRAANEPCEQFLRLLSPALEQTAFGPGT